MINSDLLKEAIADAKAVRATALANAKASLEEAFAPRFEAMFADKLKEESEDEIMAEVEAPNQVSGQGGEAKGPKTKAVSKGQPKKVSDAKSNFKTVAVGGSEGAAGSKAPAATQSIVKETEDVDDEEKDKVEETADVQEESGFTTEELDEIIKELEAEVADEEEGAPAPDDSSSDEVPDMGDGSEAPAVSSVPPSPMPQAPVGPTSSPSPMGGCQAPVAPLPVQPQGDMVSQTLPSPVVGGSVAPTPLPSAPPMDDPAQDNANADDEEINLEELLASLQEEVDSDEEDEKEKMEEISNNGVPTNVDGQDKDMKTTSNKNIESTKNPNHNIQGKGNIGGGEVGGKPKMEEITKYKGALKEAYDTIGYLRGQINEVNLLNAKLLYTNKLFKEFAGVLDDSYRLKIVENFDLTKSVREVKLAYALLAESLNFGTTKSATAKPQASKPVVKKSVAQITEGLASKPVASTKPTKEILAEGSEMASRFQKLAGIKKKTIAG